MTSSATPNPGPAITSEQAGWFAEAFAALVGNVSRAILGKDHVLRLAATCLFAEGHLLLEDFPGTGKTTLARALAQSVHGSHSRIQFTPDLLPSDVTGVTIFDQQSQDFEFHPGPIFASIVLADEINRASPKTQSALLEVMEESSVTVDGTSHPVGSPFMVIATQNPIEQAGTYRLPEAQLDRFLMKTSLGHPDHASAVQILATGRPRTTVLTPVLSTEAVVQMGQIAAAVTVQPAILEYVTQIAEETRQTADVRLGASMRGCLALVRSARVWAAAQGRTFVVPDDVKTLARPCLTHRLILDPESEFDGITADEVMSRVLQSVTPPQLSGVA